MIDIQYIEFIENFSADLKFVLLNMIDIIETDEERNKLRFENILNELIQDGYYHYINDKYLLKVDLSIDKNSYEKNLSLNESYTSDFINDITEKLKEIKEFSISKLRIYSKHGADITVHYL